MSTADPSYYADEPTTSLRAAAPQDEVLRWVQIAKQRRRGVQLMKEKNFAAAVNEFDAILSFCGTYAEVWFRRGVGLAELRQFDLAYESIAQAVALTPLYPEARQHLAHLGQMLGRAPAILTPWEENPKPRWTDRVAYKLKRLIAAKPGSLPSEEELRQKLLRNPRDTDAAVLIGWRFAMSERYAEAECFFRYVLQIAPWSSYAAAYLSRIAASYNAFEAASDIAANALKAGAEDKGLSTVALWCARSVCKWADHDRWVERCFRRLAKNPVEMDPFVALNFFDEPALQQRMSIAFATHRAAGAQPIPAQFRTSADRPLTVGYISADFRVHPGSYLFAELFELHDRSRFRIYGYGVFNGDIGEIGRRVRSAFDKFVDLSTMPPGEAAETIRRDRVDILVDLTGFTQNPPFPIVARKPAPIQVNYLGYPGTFGSPVVDYIVADKAVVSREQERWFTEKLVYMPDCYQVNDRKRAISKAKISRSDFDLPDEGMVYCCFNDPRKISPSVFRIWMSILRRVPGSVLWLLAPTDDAVANLLREVERAGVDTHRIKFARKLGSEEHLARYRLCDLFLDTLPYNAHTTASEALWSGCPVLTHEGKTFPARVAASILRAASLPDLITTSSHDYEELAVRIGSDPDLRAGFKKRVAAARTSSALFDTPRFVRHLEWAFEKMWAVYVSGQPPATFEVPSAENAT